VSRELSFEGRLLWTIDDFALHPVHADARAPTYLCSLPL
jgi:hypothetical protein